MTKSHMYLVALLAVVTSACSGAALKKDWETTRGYAPADVEAIMAQHKEYNTELSMAQHSSNAFNSAPVTAVETKFKTIFCNCYKKLGAKCREKNAGYTGAERDLWVKANAIDMAYAGQHTSMDAGGPKQFDGAECPQ